MVVHRASLDSMCEARAGSIHSAEGIRTSRVCGRSVRHGAPLEPRIITRVLGDLCWGPVRGGLPRGGAVEVLVEDVGSVDGGFDAVSVVLLEHAEVFVAELVGDLFDGHAGVGHEAGGGVAEHVWCPVSVDACCGDDGAELGPDALWVGGFAGW